MIITKSKHNKIVSLKDADIKILKNVIASKNREIDCRKKESERMKLEISQAIETIKDNNVSIDLLADKVEHLEKENEELADKLINIREDLKEAYMELDKYKKDRQCINALKQQYKWHIDNAIKCKMISPSLTREDVKRMVSKEGIDCILDFNMLFSLL